MSFSTVAAAALALLQTAVPIWETHPTLSCMRQVRADCDYVNFVCELWREPAVKPVIVDFNAGEVSGSLWSAGIVGRSEPLHEGNYFSRASAEDAPFVGLPSGAIQVTHRRTFPRDLYDRPADFSLGERNDPRQGRSAAIRSSAFGGAKSFNGFIKVLSVTGDRFSCR